VLGELVLGDGVVGVAEDREVLEAHGGGRELRGGACGLAEVDDRRARDRGLDGRGRRRAPHRVEHVARALAPERVREGGDEVVGVEPHRCVGPELGGALEPPLAAPGGDDAGRAEELRGLHRDEPDAARRAQHEDVLATLERRAPREGEPPGEPRDPEPGRHRRVGTVRDADRHRVVDREPLGHRAVACPTECPAEHPDDRAVGSAADAFAPRDVRERRRPGGEHAPRDREVDRVDRRREHVHHARLRDRLHRPDLGGPTELPDQRCPHGAHPTRRSASGVVRSVRPGGRIRP
jgi:hypothetical protein